jgi:hypothetical protein
VRKERKLEKAPPPHLFTYVQVYYQRNIKSPTKATALIYIYLYMPIHVYIYIYTHTHVHTY